jgi:hypothetical protein
MKKCLVRPGMHSEEKEGAGEGYINKYTLAGSSLTLLSYTGTSKRC